MNANNNSMIDRASQTEAKDGVRSVSESVGAASFVLRRASEVDAENATASPLSETIGWVRKFLARPHPELGRSGPVCPFTPMALELDTMWMTEIKDSAPDPQRIYDVIEQCRKVFMDTEPRDGAMAINKVIMVVFSGLGPDAAPWIDEMQAKLKPNFVDIGLMLGEFHSQNDTPGLRNPDFRPLRSPIPMLVIRHMVESDLPFMKRDVDRPEVRISYLRSYLRQLGTSIRRTYFDQAVDALVVAEIEQRSQAQSETLR